MFVSHGHVHVSHDHVQVANIVRHSIPSLDLLHLQRLNGWFGRVRVESAEVFDQVRCVFHFGGRNPCVFGFGVADPFDQVSDASAIWSWSCIDDSFDFVVVHFPFDDVGRWSGEVGAVFRCFFVRG